MLLLQVGLQLNTRLVPTLVSAFGFPVPGTRVSVGWGSGAEDKESREL